MNSNGCDYPCYKEKGKVPSFRLIYIQMPIPQTTIPKIKKRIYLYKYDDGLNKIALNMNIENTPRPQKRKRNHHYKDMSD